MRPPNTAFLVHTADTIAFGPTGTLVFTVAQVTISEAHHALQRVRALLQHNSEAAEHHEACREVFQAALADHRRARVCELRREGAL